MEIADLGKTLLMFAMRVEKPKQPILYIMNMASREELQMQGLDCFITNTQPRNDKNAQF